MAACGLDFGTSNTTLGIMSPGGPSLVALEDGHDTVPSAVFFDGAAEPRIGRAAIGLYVDGHGGRLLRSLKSALGSALIDEATQVGRRRLRFSEVIGVFLGLVKARAEASSGHAFDRVVLGRPVFFVDDDDAGNRKAEEALRRAAEAIGFADVSFQYEPLAAALDYEQQVTREEIALIADIGGGTSDFSIVRIGPGRQGRADRAADILANDGVRVGGTDFDRLLSLGALMPLLGHGSAMRRAGRDVPTGYFHDLATWSAINRLYAPKVLREVHEIRREAAAPGLVARLAKVVEEERGHTLAMQVEAAKIDLSAADVVTVDLGWLEPGLATDVDRARLVALTASLAERIAARIDICLGQAGLPAEAIDAVFMTGGSTRLAHVRRAIVEAVPRARVVEGDTFGSVGTGLAIEAARRYGR